MTRNRFWRVMLVLGLAALHAGAAQATGTGFGGGGQLDAVFTSGDGTLEFSDFRFRGIDPDDVTIEMLTDGILFRGDESASGFGLDRFQISYTVRTRVDSGITGTTLGLDSRVDARNGAVIASKKISAPREGDPVLPWVSLRSWDDDHHSLRDFARKLGRKGGHGPEHIGTLYAYEIASGWICGCGHHHARLDDVESECRIERDTDQIDYDPESELRIEDTVKLLSFGRGGASWSSLTNRYVVAPEPGTAALLALGLTGLLASARRRH